MSGGGSVKVELLGTSIEEPAPDPPPKHPPNSCEYPECRKSFIKPSLLQYHIDTVHKKLKLFMCIYPGCEQSFYLNSKMQRHHQTHMEKKFRCPWCEKMFNRKDNLNHHQKTCQIVLICAVCGATFLSSAELNEHSVSHGQMLKCVVEGCEERMSASTLTEHITRCHASVIKCACCTKVYPSQEDLTAHFKAAHDRQELVLDEPLDIELWLRTEIFAAASGQGPALTEEHDVMVENQLNCQDNQGASIPELPPLPTEQASEPKLFRCTYENCTYSTPTPRWLTKHALKHKRQNKCDHCEKMFADRWSLTLHTRTHNTEDVTFPCATCGKVFQSNGRLSQHVQTYHKDSLEWVCDRVGCGERFSTHRRLLQHHKYHALGTEPVPSRCAKRSADKPQTDNNAAVSRNPTVKKSRRKKKEKTFHITMTTPETYKHYIEPPAS